MAKLQKTSWAAIRQCEDDGHEWIDIDSLGSCRAAVDRKVEETRNVIPHWDDANPVVRIVPVEIAVKTID